MVLTQITIGDARFPVGRWKGSAEVAKLIAMSEARTLDRGILRAARTILQNQGFKAVITAPVGPAERTAFQRDDFSEREQLHLLSCNLQTRSHTVAAGGSATGDSASGGSAAGGRAAGGSAAGGRTRERRRPRTRKAKRRDWDEILAVDQLSFDEFWRFDREGLEDSIEATPASRLRVVRGTEAAGQTGHASAGPAIGAEKVGQAGGHLKERTGARGTELLGYALSGQAGQAGYLQRLAVHPAWRQQGVGKLLVEDALAWLRRRGAVTGWVNTQTQNEAALRLYQRLGFVLQEHPLTVMHRALT